MPADEREWWRERRQPPDERDRSRREGYGPNVRWESLTEEQRTAAWRLAIGLAVFFGIIGTLFD